MSCVTLVHQLEERLVQCNYEILRISRFLKRTLGEFQRSLTLRRFIETLGLVPGTKLPISHHSKATIN